MMKIEDLNFSVRTYNILKRARIDTTEQLKLLTDDELMCIRNLGKHSLDEIHEKLERNTKTNGDRIRAMSDEELAKFFDCFDSCAICPEAERLNDNPLLRNEKCDEDCVTHVLNWLKQPAEVDRDTD